LLLCLLIVGCRQKADPIQSIQMLSGRTMGTTYSIKVAPKGNIPSLLKISKEVERVLAEVNLQMSTYIPDSEISRFNASESTEWFAVSPETASVVQMAQDISAASNGAFDVTVGPLVDLWGFGATGKVSTPPSSEQVAEVIEVVGFQKLEYRLDPPALRKQVPRLQVDLSAIAKGHGVDRVAERLFAIGVNHFFVEVGGEVRTSGTKMDGQRWRVGIEEATAELPSGDARPIYQVLELSAQALATSGNYRNYFEANGRRYAHTLDPRTGVPAEVEIASASVVAESCALADGVATAMMCVGYKAGLELAEQNGWAVLLMIRSEGTFSDVRSTRFNELFPRE
jgi:FAD:protein FMN transferase